MVGGIGESCKKTFPDRPLPCLGSGPYVFRHTQGTSSGPSVKMLSIPMSTGVCYTGPVTLGKSTFHLLQHILPRKPRLVEGTYKGYSIRKMCVVDVGPCR